MVHRFGASRSALRPHRLGSMLAKLVESTGLAELIISTNLPFNPTSHQSIGSTDPVRYNPNVAKVGGLQSQGVKVEIVVGYIDPLTTQDLKFSGFPDVLGRS
jgi:hypothetical protein